MSGAIVCLLCERCGCRTVPLGTPDALCGPCRGHARPLDYAGRCERYARQRGWHYDPERLASHHLTPRQRRRAMHKERHAWPRYSRRAIDMPRDPRYAAYCLDELSDGDGDAVYIDHGDFEWGEP